MKINKTSFLLLLSIVIIISISVVSASDNSSFYQTDESISDMDNFSQLTVYSDELGSFRELQNEFNKGGTIDLNKDYKLSNDEFDNYKEGIDISKSITVNGNGFTIDCKNINNQSVRAFKVINTVTVQLNNINIINSNSNSASIDKGSFLMAAGTNCKITLDNVGVNNSQGNTIIDELGNNNKITLTKCNFSNNKGIILSNDGYGSFFENVDGCTFSNNNGMIIDSVESIKNSYFINNKGSDCLYKFDGSSASISNCVFMNNNYLGQGLIENQAMALSFKYNIFINNTPSRFAYEWGYMDGSYNYWGMQNNPSVSLFSEDSYITNNVKLNIEGPDEISDDAPVEYTISFVGINNNVLVSQMPTVTIPVSINNIATVSSPLIIKSGVGKVTINPIESGVANFIIGSDNLLSKEITINASGKKLPTIVLSGNDTFDCGSLIKVNISLFDDKTPINGEVIVTLNNESKIVEIVDGKGVYTNENQIPSGNYEINIIFKGDNQYKQVNQLKYITLNKVDSKITLNVIPSEIKDGNEVTVEANILNKNNGIISNVPIEFYCNNELIGTINTDSNGMASLKYKPVKVGINNFTAVFNGNDMYNSVESSLVTVNVTPKVYTVLNFTAVCINSSSEYLFNIHLINNQTKEPIVDAKIDIYCGDELLTSLVTDSEGKASYTHSFDKGAYIITAKYAGDATFYPFTSQTGLAIANGNTFTDLYIILESSLNNSVIKLNKDYYFDPASDGKYAKGILIENKKNLTIDFNCHCVNASNLSSIFDIKDSDLTLKNGVFKNAVTNFGAAIKVSKSNLVVLNSTVTNVINLELGDSSLNLSKEDVLKIATFIENYYVGYNKLPEYITYNNKQYPLSWISYALANAVLNYYNNNFNNVSLKNIDFASNPTGIEDPTKLYTKEAYISNNNGIERGGFTKRFVDWCNNNNQIPNYMGASPNNIYALPFIESTVRVLSYYAIHNEFPDNTFYNSNVKIDELEKSGIGFYSYASNVSLINSNFTKLNDNAINGGIYLDESTSTINNCLFNDNIASSAGAIYLRLGKLDIINSSFNNNTAIGEGFGGVINTQLANLKIIESNFTNNKAKGNYSQGGVATINGNTLEIYGSKFENNTAGVGGAFYLTNKNENSVPIVNSNFTNNNATVDCGGVLYGKEFNIINSRFINNSAKNSAGVISVLKSCNVYNSMFIGNKAGKNSGVIENYDPDFEVPAENQNVFIFNSKFINNTASTYASGVFSVNIYVTNSSFIANKAFNNDNCIGGIFRASKLDVKASTFINNSAVKGAVAVVYQNGTFTNSIFIGNRAPDGSILSLNPDCYCNFNYNIFINNGEKLIVKATDGDFELPNLNYNYWGTNNPQDSLTDGFSLGQVVIIGVVGDNKIFTEIPSEIPYIYKINFTGENADKLPYFSTDLKLSSDIAKINISNVNLSKDNYISLVADNKGNTSLIIGSEYGNLLEYPIEIQQLIRKNYTFEIDVNNLTYGEGQVVNFTFKDAEGKDMDGVITVKFNNQIQEIDILNGKGQLTIPSGFDAGNYSIYVNYTSKDLFYNNFTSVANFTIFKAKSDLNITINDIVFGEDGNLIINFTNGLTGDLIITINGKDSSITLPNDKFSINVSIPKPPAGNYNIKVNYIGDNNFNATEKSIDFNVNKAPSSINIEVGDIVMGENINIYGNVIKGSTGNVTFSIIGLYNPRDRLVDSNGTAVWLISPLNPGNYTIFAKYNGDSNYLPSNTTYNLVIDKINTTMDISVDVDKNMAVVNITLIPELNGEVNVTLGNISTLVKIVNGKGAIIFDKIPVGSYTVYVNYEGDKIYNPIEVNKTFEVKSCGLTVIESSNLVIYYLNGGNFTITLVDAKGNVLANQTVIFEVNGVNYTRVTNADGVASISIKLIPGDYVIKTYYEGNGVQDAAVAVNNIEVLPMFSTVNVVNEGSNDNVTFNIVMNYPANGTVTVGVDNKTYSVDMVDGRAVLTIPPLAAGDYSADVSYNGLVNTTASFNVQYVRDNTTTILSKDIELYYKNGTSFQVTLIDVDGNVLVNQTVFFEINGVNYTRVTNDDGVASMSINLIPGDYVIKTYYKGNSTQDPAMAVNNVKVLSTISDGKDITLYFRNGTRYSVKVLDGHGNPAVNVTVRFNINGVEYKKITDKDGFASLAINLNPGTYIITAETPNGIKMSNNITVLPTISGENVVKYFRNGTQYHVKVFDGNGNPAAGQNVTFNINGVFYHKVTDENGVATLNINLSPGVYSITASFNGLNVNNKVEVLPIISANDLSKKFGERATFDATVVDAHGKPIAGQNVTFNVNGVFYHKVSDANGVAKLNINLPVGKYIITSEYNNCKTANHITVTK